MLGYLPDLCFISSFDAADDGKWLSLSQTGNGRLYKQCTNYVNQQICNWMVAAEDPLDLCESCRMTKMIPSLSTERNHTLWQQLENAKRRLLYSLWSLNLRCSPDGGNEMLFQFIEDDKQEGQVLTGHKDGLITININEADPVMREATRERMHERYRTLLGHFRHESGHYYFDRLIAESDWVNEYRELFGDEQQDYSEHLKNYYMNGPPADWEARFISAYASAHPHEDWAETWAHYLHMMDALETAQECGLSLAPGKESTTEKGIGELSIFDDTFDDVIANWFALTYVLNSLSRSVGMPDAYPFKLSTPVQSKLYFIHKVVTSQVIGKANSIS